MESTVKKILRLKREKDAIIMAHYYQSSEIQDLADFVGDSLALAQEAAKTKAKIIVLAGVHFMGETAKIICPDKRVFVPDINAGCSLADSCPPLEFQKFINKYPEHTIISYVNTSAEIKALTDVVVTSTNAQSIVESFPKDAKLIFGPDKNLGNYINSITNRNMILWNGACHVHEKFSLEKMISLRDSNFGSEIISHPECKTNILLVSDFIGSTAALLNYTIISPTTVFIVATESGILHQMRLTNPNKLFIPAPPADSTCACNDCEYMKLNTVAKILDCLENEVNEIIIDEVLRSKAYSSIARMLELSEKYIK